MRTLTTTEYREVCKSYAQFGSKLFDEMFSYLYSHKQIFKQHPRLKNTAKEKIQYLKNKGQAEEELIKLVINLNQLWTISIIFQNQN